jgi:hypothetical protein
VFSQLTLYVRCTLSVDRVWCVTIVDLHALCDPMHSGFHTPAHWRQGYQVSEILNREGTRGPRTGESHSYLHCTTSVRPSPGENSYMRVLSLYLTSGPIDRSGQEKGTGKPTSWCYPGNPTPWVDESWSRFFAREARIRDKGGTLSTFR